ncbi:thioredoxin [Stygiolobus caldivivus]|uniref:Thiol reductase thioredoxin n=1 Tax=Stygiolobus caldivivus TaxID=2824673 RepID=A0A8D5U734_9CREN|nr:thioredoxin [Stygiolobus caldivivus]BCU70781.1 thiol reductase thioredoxin [Stygiolobus caldivivus]
MSELDELVKELSKKLEEKAKNVINPQDVTVTITDSNIDDILSKNNVVFIDCWAPWCAPCHLYEPIFKKIADKYKDKATFGRLNVDENPKTADKYGVMNIPTTLIFVNGKLADQIIGAVEEEMLEDYVRKYINA